jgi:hypothetical protein
VRLISFSILLFLLPELVNAQRWWVGAEASYTSDLFKVDDSHGSIRTIPLPGIETGIGVRRMLNHNLFIEGNVSTKPYMAGYAFNGATLYAWSKSFQAVMVKGAIGYRIFLTEKLALVPKAGVAIGANTAYYLGSGSFKEILHNVNGSDIHSDYTESSDVNRFFGLANVSFGVERNFFKSFVASIHAGYHAGFMKVTRLDGQYTIDQSPTYYATARSNGSYWDIGVNVFYKITRSRKHAMGVRFRQP